MNWKTPAILAIMLFVAAVFVAALDTKTESGPTTLTSAPVTVTIQAPVVKAGIPYDNIVDVTKTGTLFVYTNLSSLLGGMEGNTINLYPAHDRDSVWRFVQKHCFTMEQGSAQGVPVYVVVDDGKCTKTYAQAQLDAQNPLLVKGLETVVDLKPYGTSRSVKELVGEVNGDNIDLFWQTHVNYATTPGLYSTPWGFNNQTSNLVKNEYPAGTVGLQCVRWEPIFKAY